jgi:tetratricopeptide (TPR) repeat protein
MNYILFILIFLLLISPVSASGQDQRNSSTDLSLGIELYNRKDFAESARILQTINRQAESVTALTYLGMDYEQLGKSGDAKKTYEQAVKLSEKLTHNWAGLSEQLKKDAQVTLYEELKQGVIAAENYIKLTKTQDIEWQGRLQVLSDILKALAPDKIVIAYTGREVQTKAKILKMPPPRYTEAARAEHISGTIQLKVILAKDRRVECIIPIKGLPKGLTLMAVMAARQITFVPATINGQPVSQWILIEYRMDGNVMP